MPRRSIVAAAACLAAGCGSAPVVAPEHRSQNAQPEVPEPPRQATLPPLHAPEPPHAGRRRLPNPQRIRPAYPSRASRALGAPSAGRLVRGVRLPAYGPDHVTWDPIRKRVPSRAWRRHGTDRLVQLVLRIAREHREAHPEAPRLVIGDLSRPRGGDFGAKVSGGLGHASHQNGLDVDVYYPRRDRRLRAPLRVDQVDRRLSQDLVDRFVAAGAQYVFVGPSVGLTGPPGRVQPLVHHDNHLHVRIAPS